MNFKEISIRGRVAYSLCVFERLLIFFGCKKKIGTGYWRNYGSIHILNI